MHDQVARDFLEKQQQKEAVAQRTAGAQRRLQELLAQRERAEHQVARGEEQLQLESEEVAALKTQKDGVARKAEAMKQADVQHTARRQQAQRAYLERLYARSTSSPPSASARPSRGSAATRSSPTCAPTSTASRVPSARSSRTTCSTCSTSASTRASSSTRSSTLRTSSAASAPRRRRWA